MKFIFSAVLASVLVGVPSVLAVDYFSPRTAALGGAGMASAQGTDAIYLNPSMASFQKTYSAGASLYKYSGRDDSEPKGRVFNAAILDGTNDLFQAGFGFTNRADAKLIHFGASKAVTNFLGLGFGAKRAFNKVGLKNQYLVSASGFFDLIPLLKVGFMADNLNESVESRRWNLLRTYGAGVKLDLMSILMLYYDPTYTPHRLVESKYGAAYGAELKLLPGVYARFGINRHTYQPALGTVGRGMGTGIGLMFPKLALEGALYRTMAPVYASGIVFSGTVSF